MLPAAPLPAVLIATFQTTAAPVLVTDQYILDATLPSQTPVEANADLKEQMSADGVNTVQSLRSIVPPIALPPAGATRAVVFAAVLAHLMMLVFPLGFQAQIAIGAPGPHHLPVLPPPPPPAAGVGVAGAPPPPGGLFAAAAPPPPVGLVGPAPPMVAPAPMAAAAALAPPFLPLGPPPPAAAPAALAAVPFAALPSPASPERPKPEGQLSAFAPQLGPRLPFPGPASGLTINVAHYYNPGNPAYTFGPGLSSAVVNLASAGPGARRSETVKVTSG